MSANHTQETQTVPCQEAEVLAWWQANVGVGAVWEFGPAANDPGTDHSARFPDELVRRCVLLSTRPGDVVADPFAGSATTPLVAEQLDRKGWGSDARDYDRADPPLTLDLASRGGGQ